MQFFTWTPLENPVLRHSDAQFSTRSLRRIQALMYGSIAANYDN